MNTTRNAEARRRKAARELAYYHEKETAKLAALAVAAVATAAAAIVVAVLAVGAAI